MKDLVSKFIVTLSLFLMLAGCASRDDFLKTSTHTIDSAGITYTFIMNSAMDMYIHDTITKEQWDKVLSVGNKWYNAYMIAATALSAYAKNADDIAKEDLTEKIIAVSKCLSELIDTVKELNLEVPLDIDIFDQIK